MDKDVQQQLQQLQKEIDDIKANFNSMMQYISKMDNKKQGK